MNSLPSGLRWQVHGRGAPVTLVVHGLGATPGEARIPASGLSGTRVVITLPSHGDAPDAPAGYWTYPRMAEDLRAVARQVGATRAVGVSLGAGALIRLLAGGTGVFERVVLLLPAALDRPRAAPAMWAFERLAEAATDRERLAELVAAEVPPGVEVGDHVQARTAALMRLGAALTDIPEQIPVPDAAVLADVDVPVLVIGATGDPLHPEHVAKATAAAFPNGSFELVPSPAPLLTHRREVRALIVDFLAGV